MVLVGASVSLFVALKTSGVRVETVGVEKFVQAFSGC
jgi:hypothetical protein